jgi:hypothetical protein
MRARQATKQSYLVQKFRVQTFHILFWMPLSPVIYTQLQFFLVTDIYTRTYTLSYTALAKNAYFSRYVFGYKDVSDPWFLQTHLLIQ